MLRSLPFLTLCALLSCAGPATSAPARPNILWITAEDMSATLGCYDDEYAITPNIDAFAKESVRYTHAFATSPVCSPSRACLINGLIASSQGTQHMRSAIPLPPEMKGFPAWLRVARYYTTHNLKTDYNSANADVITAASWDESNATAHWRGRINAKQPFFAVFNLMTTHQSRTMVWPFAQFVGEVQSKLSPEEIHDPDTAAIPPYYSDTKVIRKTIARFYDCVTAMDKEVGAILRQLDTDGLADDTIVFFYSDHGSGMPRHKRALLDSGMRVPLIIRFPEKYRELAPGPPGSTTDRLVSFEDFGPTVLSLAGIEKLPPFMQGRPFLGPLETEPREFVFGHRDRVDEIADLARSVRDGRYLYIRNYMPHLGYNQQGAWIDQGDIQHEFYRLAADPDKLTDAQWHFAGPLRAVEELYDCGVDPENLENLTFSPDHAAVLERMRGAHREWLRESRDLGFLHEIELERIASTQTPYDWAREPGAPNRQAERIAAASLVGKDAGDAFRENLEHADPSVRYWGAVAFSAAPRLPSEIVPFLETKLEDPSPAVRIEVANALARHGRIELGLPVLIAHLQDENPTAILHAARAIELLGDDAVDAHADMQALAVRFEEEPGDPAMFIRFAATGYLNRVEP